MYEPGSAEIGRALVRAIHGHGHNFLIVAFTPELVIVEPVTDEVPDTMPADSVATGDSIPQLHFLPKRRLNLKACADEETSRLRALPIWVGWE